MKSKNHWMYPTCCYRNDYNFASCGDFSASVLSTSNAARFDGELSAAGQIAPAENILSGRAIAAAQTGCMHGERGSATTSFPVASDSDMAIEPVFFYRATLFDQVMDFLDGRDRMAAQEQSSRSAE